MIKLKVKNIEMALQDVEIFEKPKVELEQYHTPPRTAAEILYKIETTYGDISEMKVADFGCGPGILSIGSALLGAELVHGYDIDDAALEIAKRNIENMELVEFIELFKIDISQLKLPRPHFYDTIIMNPPFGTRKEGIDMVFLKTAFENCSGAVYSLHKSNTTEYIKKQTESWGAKFELVERLKFPLPKTYKHQKKGIYLNQELVDVDLIRVSHQVEKKELK